MPRLRRVDCSGPGISRRRRGRGFEYVDADGTRIEEAEALERIRELVIPPAWKDVWICPYPHGHIQAVGTDAAGRRQYLYHRSWRERRDILKYERVLACAVRLLDRGFFRIGTEDYAEENQTYGLATMHRSHAKLGFGGMITFDYVSKGGKRRVQSVVDRDVYRVVELLKKRRGGPMDLLAYKANGRWVDVKSDDINDYIKAVTEDEFSAKDFRTWNATVLAAVALAVSGAAMGSKTGRRRAIGRAVEEVAHYLGNTPAVCRASYIDPRVFDRYRDGLTIGGVLHELGDVGYGESATQGAVEEAVLDLLERDLASDAIEQVA